MSYLVSVVVPTKNRYQYLKHLVKLIDSFKLDELEMVIQDNSDLNSEIKEYLSEFNNPNIKYFYCNEALTMSGNADLAIRNATGEYICYIGDDDGICRNIVDVVKCMKEQKIEALRCTSAWYLYNGRVKILKHRQAFRMFDSSKELNVLINHGLILDASNMPFIYHGIVSKAKLIVLQNRFGTCFPGNPPDIAGSIALSSVVQKYCEVYSPVVINGISNMAGGGVLKDGGVIPLDKVLFFDKHDIFNWEKNLPPFFCGAYAWANSGIKTLRMLGMEDSINKINIDYMYAHSVAYRPQIYILWKTAYRYCLNPLNLTLLICHLFFKRYFIKMKNNLWLFASQSNSANNIIEAEEFFSNYI